MHRASTSALANSRGSHAEYGQNTRRHRHRLIGIRNSDEPQIVSLRLGGLVWFRWAVKAHGNGIVVCLMSGLTVEPAFHGTCLVAGGISGN